MQHIPILRVVPLERIRAHEEIDPLRVDRLAARIGEEGTQLNPMVCTEGPDGVLVLLDGATRTDALRRLGLPYGVVQVVEPDSVILETWHHVIRGTTASEVIEAIGSRGDLRLVEDEGAPRVLTPGEARHTVYGVGLSPNGTLSSLVDAYIGHWDVNRIIEPEPDEVAWRFPDWAALVEFPPLTVEDVMKAAVGNDLLPAGITRFVVPDRALRLKMSLDLLRSPGTAEEKQAELDHKIEERAREGRIRRYEEPVIILDD